MSDCLIGLGSNMGDRAAMLRRAEKLIDAHPQIHVAAHSALRETTPVGGPAGQDAFLNSVLLATTRLAPDELLSVLLEVEQQLGRQRGERWSARSIDLDLLLYADRIIATERLTIPHPRMAFRRFVLEAAVEVAGDMVHPTTGRTLRQLLSSLDNAPDYIAVCGFAPGDAALLTERAADTGGWRRLAADDATQRIALLEAPGPSDRGQAAIDLLQRRAAMLRAELPLHGRLISDFWLGECVALARAVLPEQQFEKFKEAQTPIMAGLPSPKLLVVCDRPVDSLREFFSARSSRAPTQLADAVHRCLSAQIAPPSGHPVLHVPVQDIQFAVDEVVAAMAAMQ